MSAAVVVVMVTFAALGAALALADRAATRRAASEIGAMVTRAARAEGWSDAVGPVLVVERGEVGGRQGVYWRYFR